MIQYYRKEDAKSMRTLCKRNALERGNLRATAIPKKKIISSGLMVFIFIMLSKTRLFLLLFWLFKIIKFLLGSELLNSKIDQ